MKLIELRSKIDIAALSAALIIAIMPLFGLLSGVAISVGLYGANYEEVLLKDNPDQYWFIIKIELAVVLSFLALSLLRFPFFEHMYRKIELFEEKNKVLFVSLMYLGVSIIATIVIVLVVAII